jgi:hypothetical protein
MPTFERTDDLIRDWRHLSPDRRAEFKAAIKLLVDDLRAGHGIRPGLGVKRFRSVPDVWEFAWSPNGRALFRYGTSPHADDVHRLWLRVGTHAIYKPRG